MKMLRYWIIGASAVALATGTASAQFDPPPPGTTVVVTQVGDNNEAKTTQNGDMESYIIIRQEGDDNYAENNQTGNDNTSQIHQWDIFGFGLVTENSYALVNQSDTGSASNFDNVAIQSGESNRVTVTMGPGSNNKSRPTQLGNQNVVNMTIAGANNYSRVVQGGRAFGLTASNVEDFYGNPETGCTFTTGCVYDYVPGSDRNFAEVTFDAGATGSISNIAQSGTDNLANVSIYGDSQRSEIQQECGGFAFCGNNSADVTMNASAVGAVSEVFQTGVSNSATVVRNNPTATTTVNQTGIGNVATVTQ